MIRWTHFYHLLYQVLILGGGALLMAVLGDALSGVLTPADHLVSGYIQYAKDYLTDHGFEWLAVVIQIALAIIGIVIFFAVFGGCVFLLAKTILPPYLPTYCYVNYSLGIKINPVEAAKLSFLFDGDLNGIWYPLRSLKKIDKEFRREALFSIANEIATKHGRWIPFPQTTQNERVRDKGNRERPRDDYASSTSQAQNEKNDPTTAQYLSVLGFEKYPATHEVLRTAYLIRLKEFHPDKFATERPEIVKLMEEKTKQLNLAYEYLSQHFTSGPNS